MTKVALCAFGMSGRVFHAPFIEFEPRLILDTILQRTGDEAALAYPKARIVRDFSEILADPSIDLVIVNTPNRLHTPMVRAALEARKHVVVEKPFTITAGEGRDLMERARQAGRLLAVYHNKRLESDFFTLQKILAAGLLGRLVELEWHYDRFRTHVTHKRWKEDEQPGAGTWYDLGIHLVDAMLCLFGRPDAVDADLRALRREEGSIDYFNVRFHYPDHRVILRSSTFVREPGPVLMAHGDKGSFICHRGDQQEAQLQAGLRPGQPGWGVVTGTAAAIINSEIDGAVRRESWPITPGCYEEFYRNIADSLLDPAKLQFGPEQAIAAVEMIEAAMAANGAGLHPIIR